MCRSLPKAVKTVSPKTRALGLERLAGEGALNLDILILVWLALIFAATPARAEVEQCRFIPAKPEREACYERQAAALAARRKPEPSLDARTAETKTFESLQQMRREDAEVYRSLQSICRGC
jgi:hypothetical protein